MVSYIYLTINTRKKRLKDLFIMCFVWLCGCISGIEDLKAKRADIDKQLQKELDEKVKGKIKAHSRITCTKSVYET